MKKDAATFPRFSFGCLLKWLKSKAVIRFSMNNKLIDEFESINIASNITGINKRGIALAANKKLKTAGGYIWKIK